MRVIYLAVMLFFFPEKMASSRRSRSRSRDRRRKRSRSKDNKRSGSRDQKKSRREIHKRSFNALIKKMFRKFFSSKIKHSTLFYPKNKNIDFELFDRCLLFYIIRNLCIFDSTPAYPLAWLSF